MAKLRKKAIASLSAGRPKVAKPNTSSKPSSKQGRALIRKHHTLSKELANAIAARDESKVHFLQAEIDAQGGITAYQQASRAGQSAERGGDTSRVLIEWLKGIKPLNKLRMLEVGALAVDNACARSGMFQMTRIDLHSDIDGIEQQDFMERPPPTCEAECFDCISLSLVVNYVPEPQRRGEMLKRLRSFLKCPTDEEALLPSAFLVLPAPCVINSRYMTEQRLEQIMISLGFRLARRKLSAKLIYQLWIHIGGASLQQFPKIEVNPGAQRNNFSVILENDDLS